MTFRRVLIANRGEIACRITATLHALGIEAVAVYADADRDSRHVLDADVAVALGGNSAAESYLRIDAVLDAARRTGAEAIHPGYGLLAENATFAEACEAAGVVFIGPTPQQLRSFGHKHSARQAAVAAGVPLLDGTGLLDDVDAALAAARTIGYPVMLKASAGGGGIGMRACADEAELTVAFEAVTRLAQNNFGGGGVFLEQLVSRARHVEVQIFGDGQGAAIALGERDCSAQRRNQKVLEEAPAPNLSDALRAELHRHAIALARSVRYRSAGTVEFLVDAERERCAFLEVNTRLQVEHGVTELTHGIDLVAMMVQLAAGERPACFERPPVARGAAIEVRLCAEDPEADYRPSTGVLTEVVWPPEVRVDTWIERGSEVSPYFDSLLAKLLVVAPTRQEALERLRAALAATRLGGPATNLGLLRTLADSPELAAGTVTTDLLARLPLATPAIEVIQPGTFSTVQDLPGRTGLWDVGVPPSGPMDDRSFALANELVGNEAGAAGLELTMTGPTLRFRSAARIALGGADFGAEVDGEPLAPWTARTVAAGSVLRLGAVRGPGVRGYLAVTGGIDVPVYLGSRSTFSLGRFGGHAGRALRAGDVLAIGAGHDAQLAGPTVALAAERVPVLTNRWTVGVSSGPHAAPDFFTEADIDALYGTEWEVHYHSDRTGVRLVGPRPQWARPDGGEAGLHPSNIHDNAYAIGTVDFTGDMPIILGRDGPSLGGFVCPATVLSDELWKVGQARAGDTIRFQLRSPLPAVLARRPAVPAPAARPELTFRRDGDRHLLVECGDNELDLLLRLRIGALMDAVRAGSLVGVGELVPGIRSLQIAFDPAQTSAERLIDAVGTLDEGLGRLDELELPSRIVHLPLSWDDPATREATEKYMQTVRADAPWCPWNIEFIRRINGLADTEEVRRIVYDANYLVLGLGDVYLGAPVATPVDPRHRLVTTKYNPARTWTAENSVGIGGAYLCIYGMEGPGGYQFVGRTVQVWNTWRRVGRFERPWLLRFFDQIRWEEVSAADLLRLREDQPVGRWQPRIETTTFSVASYLRTLAEQASEIERFTATRRAAFAAERSRWEAAGLELRAAEVFVDAVEAVDDAVPDGMEAVRSPLTGNVWKLTVEVGDEVRAGDVVMVIEAMKTETEVRADRAGRVEDIRCRAGRPISAGSVAMVLR